VCFDLTLHRTITDYQRESNALVTTLTVGATTFVIKKVFSTKVQKGLSLGNLSKVMRRCFSVGCVNTGTVSDVPISVASEVNDDHGDLEAAPTQRNGYRPLAVDEVCGIPIFKLSCIDSR